MKKLYIRSVALVFQPFFADRYARAWTNGAVFVHLTLAFWAPVCSFIWVGFYLAIFSVPWEQSDYPSTWNRIKRLSITQAQLLNQPSQSAKPAVSEKRACKNLSFICVLTKMQGKHECFTFPEVKQLTPVGCFFSCRPTQWWKIQSGHTQLVCLRRLYFYLILDFFFRYCSSHFLFYSVVVSLPTLQVIVSEALVLFPAPTTVLREHSSYLHMCRPQYLKLIMPCVIWAYTIVIVYTHTHQLLW